MASSHVITNLNIHSRVNHHVSFSLGQFSDIPQVTEPKKGALLLAAALIAISDTDRVHGVPSSEGSK